LAQELPEDQLIEEMVLDEQQFVENIPLGQAQMAQPIGDPPAAAQENIMAIDFQLPEYLSALGQQINAEHNLGPVNQQFNVNINMALTNVVFSGADPLAKNPPRCLQALGQTLLSGGLPIICHPNPKRFGCLLHGHVVAPCTL
jgi:hypothetical protein